LISGRRVTHVEFPGGCLFACLFVSFPLLSAGWGKLETGDVLEISTIERPQGRVLQDGMGRDRQVDLAATCSIQGLVELAGQFCLSRSERQSVAAWEEGFLCRKLLFEPRPSPPLVQNQGRYDQALCRLDEGP
jgi:hypothetical protein